MLPNGKSTHQRSVAVGERSPLRETAHEQREVIKRQIRCGLAVPKFVVSVPKRDERVAKTARVELFEHGRRFRNGNATVAGGVDAVEQPPKACFVGGHVAVRRGRAPLIVQGQLLRDVKGNFLISTDHLMHEGRDHGVEGRHA